MRKGLSEKELGFISKLELKQKYFFTRDDIKDNFKTKNEMNVYLHRLKRKGRIKKLNKAKYFLIPVKAVNTKWAEHPSIIIDEVMNSKDEMPEFEVPCLNKKELIAGKVMATCQRYRPRDYLDLYFLIKFIN